MSSARAAARVFGVTDAMIEREAKILGINRQDSGVYTVVGVLSATVDELGGEHLRSCLQDNCATCRTVYRAMALYVVLHERLGGDG